MKPHFLQHSDNNEQLQMYCHEKRLNPEFGEQKLWISDLCIGISIYNLYIYTLYWI